MTKLFLWKKALVLYIKTHIKKLMELSIIIPTYKRSDDLKDTIDSILAQSMLPKEIIVVDSAYDTKTKIIVEKYTAIEHTIPIYYVLNQIDSSAVARNVGADYASSDILLFLDDDAILDEDYIKEIHNAYTIFENAIIVQGNIISEDRKIRKVNKIWNGLWQNYNKCFNLFHSTPHEMKVLKSGRTTAPPNPSFPINCQWASGCNFSIKKEVFNKYKFDENLMKYAYGEDKDLSYRIYKEHPMSIYLIPNAKLLHKGFFNKNAPVKRAVIAEKTYALYFVAKNMNKPLNYSLFMWSEFGNLLTDIIYLFLFIFRYNAFFSLKVKYDVYAYYVCAKYFSSIKNKDLEHINEKYIL